MHSTLEADRSVVRVTDSAKAQSLMVSWNKISVGDPLPHGSCKLGGTQTNTEMCNDESILEVDQAKSRQNQLTCLIRKNREMTQVEAG